MIKIDKGIVSNRFNSLLRETNLSQTEFSSTVSMTPHGVNDIIHCRRNFTANEIYRICKIYKVSADWLLGIE